MKRRFYLLPALLVIPVLLHAEGFETLSGEGWAGLLSLGFLFGLKHALDADHLVAIGTISSENRGRWGAVLTGLWWGIGHTLSLLVAGVAVLYLRIEIDAEVERMLEMGVAAMIVLLGARVVLQIVRGEGALHLGHHSHGGVEHIHPHLHPAVQAGPNAGAHMLPRRTTGLRSLLIGIMHGLAGSAALMLLVLSQISQPTVGMLYILVFGLGSIIGMMAMSTLFWLPFAATASRFRRFDLGLRIAAGIGSIAFGVAMFLEQM